MLNFRFILFTSFILGVGFVFQSCKLKEVDTQKNSESMFSEYKKIIDAKTKVIIYQAKALMPVKQSGAPTLLPKDFKSRIYLDKTSSPALLRYVANNEEVRLFGLNYELPTANVNAMTTILRDISHFRELGVGIVRVTIVDQQAQEADSQVQVLHYFMEQLDKNEIFVHLNFTHPQFSAHHWFNLRNRFGKMIKDHRNIALIEIPAFQFEADPKNPEAALKAAQDHYRDFYERVRGETDYPIATAMPVFTGPMTEKYRKILADTKVEVLTFTQQLQKPEDLKISDSELQSLMDTKAKAVSQLLWNHEQSEIYSLPAMAQKWREMGIQTAAGLPQNLIAEIADYATLQPQKWIAFKTAVKAFALTTDDNKKTISLNNDDVIKAPWSAFSKSANAIIFRSHDALMFAGQDSQWQPFARELPDEDRLQEVACVGDCPYWRATFSDLSSQNHPGLITLRKSQTEEGAPAYTIRIQSWINKRGPASVLQDGWLVFSLKPNFPQFKNLRQKSIEIKNPSTQKWEKYQINGKDYSHIGTKNPATGLPYIVIQSGAEYRIR